MLRDRRARQSPPRRSLVSTPPDSIGRPGMNLPDGLLSLLGQPSPCFLATSMPDGSPQLTQTWVDTDGEQILINSVAGFQKIRNIERDPRVAVTVSYPQNPAADHHRSSQDQRQRVSAGHTAAVTVAVMRSPPPGVRFSYMGSRSRQSSALGPSPPGGRSRIIAQAAYSSATSASASSSACSLACRCA